MISTKAYIYSTLSTDATLLALIGDATHISNFMPEVISVFPMVVFQDLNQVDFEFSDNLPIGSSADVQIDIYVKANAGAKTTWDIGSRVYDIMRDKFFACKYNGEVPDPTEGVRHRIMRFSREFFRGE
jgi:hypothetical protein